MKRINRTGLLCIMGLLLLFVIGTVASYGNSNGEYITDIQQLNDNKYTITLDAGSSAALDAKKAFPNANFSYSKSAPDAYLAVSQGTADAFVYGKTYIQYALATESFDNLTILDGVLNTADIAAGINPNRDDLVEDINKFIKQIKSDGTFDDMYDRWIVQGDDTMPEIPAAKNPDKTIRFGTSGLVVPMNYYGDNNELTGFDVEFMRRLALYLNADYTIDVMGFDALVASLQSDRLDVVVSDLNITEERQEVITFSDPYIESETAVVVRKAPTDTNNAITSLDQLNGKNIGCLDGSTYIQDVKNAFPDSTVIEYTVYAELIAALESNRIDAYIADEPMAYSQVSETDGLTILDGKISTDEYGFMLNLDNVELCNAINEAIEELKKEGVLNQLKEKWMMTTEKPVLDSSQSWEKPNGTLNVCLSLDSKPFAYLQDEQIVGYDVELMYLIAEKLGYGVEIHNYNFTALIEAVATEKEDIAIGCITHTPERAESVLFTNGTYDSGTVAVVLDSYTPPAGFFDNLKDSFDRTFIKESRWKMVANGLLVTLELSLFTFIFGSLAGFGFNFLLRSKNKVVRKTANTIHVIIDGIPLLIILMVFYYIVFADTTLSALLIGTIGLSLDFANTVAGILKTGVEGVDKGQIEAAESMGYPRWKTFMKITFPQAANQMFSQYIAAAISMVKGTSIIGYIAVVDLTKAGDVIRSLTYEAFFPLISIAVIYFLLAQIIIFLMKLVAKKLNPKERKRQIKGVKLHD